jgi:D-sedoheptulose 7-phosphate isomerase
VPSDSTPLIQQAHIVAAHLICGLFENAMFAEGATTQQSAFA